MEASTPLQHLIFETIVCRRSNQIIKFLIEEKCKHSSDTKIIKSSNLEAIVWAQLAIPLQRDLQSSHFSVLSLFLSRYLTNSQAFSVKCERMDVNGQLPSSIYHTAQIYNDSMYVLNGKTHDYFMARKNPGNDSNPDQDQWCLDLSKRFLLRNFFIF